MRLPLLCWFLVSAVPALAQSLPGQQPSKLVLVGAQGAQELALPPLPPAVGPAPTAQDPFSPVYRRMYALQLQLLELHRVSIAGPLTMTLVGATALLGGTVALFIGYAGLIVGIFMMAGSTLPLLIGIPWLVGNLGVNKKVDAQMEQLRRETQQLGALPASSGVPLAVF